MASRKEPNGKESLPLPPPSIPPDLIPSRVELPNLLPMVRPGVGTEGRQIQLLSNHFGVRISAQDAVFFHYHVSIKYEDLTPVEGKGVGRKILDRLYQTYSSEFRGKEFAYDGEKSLFTVGPLPQKQFEFIVVLEESSARSLGGSPGNRSQEEGGHKRSRRLLFTKTYVVQISFAAEVPMRSIAFALGGTKNNNTQDALRVLDIILRQQQAKRGCLLVRQSFFNGDFKNCDNLGGGVTGCRGFHSSFRTTGGGLSLNMDVTTTMLLTPGPVIDFLLANQNVRDYRQIDWTKAKRMLKNMRIKTVHTSMEFKITGLSELPCSHQQFSFKVRNGDNNEQTVQITVYDYFLQKKMELKQSADMPCLNVGKPNRPNYLPIELCNLVPLQRYTKALSSQQRASLVEKSRQKPPERKHVIIDAVRNNRYDEDPMLASCGISIERNLAQLDGRILDAPMLKVGNFEDCLPRNGRWNFNQKTLLDPIRLDFWAIVNFSTPRCDMSFLSRELIRCGLNKGVHIERPFALIEEDPQWRRAGPVIRVEKMILKAMAILRGKPQLLLCVLPERKNSDIYGPWKRKTLQKEGDVGGVVTQCISPTKINDQYLTNVLLKINTKLGGTNSLLAVEKTPSIPMIHATPTLILGMDVSHGSPGRSDVPSIAAVVGSRCWPLISRYRASVRSQSPKVEMIDSLYKPLPDGQDGGIMNELLREFYQTSRGQKPRQIIIFRDGVSESQFNQVLNIELDQIIKAISHLGVDKLPKFTVIVAQKNHHTKLFQSLSPENVPPGTVVDTKVVHPRNFDFYMCAHAGIIGTSRPTHYNVLLDEIGFSADDLQKLVHSLSYVYQRSTTAISIVAPIAYAHLAAAQVSQFMKFEEFSESSSGHGVTAAGPISVPELPILHENVASSMFFC